MSERKSWTTGDEIEFINGLINNVWVDHFRSKKKNFLTLKEKLTNYKNVLEKRANWGMVNKNIIFEYLDDKIKNIDGGK